MRQRVRWRRIVWALFVLMQMGFCDAEKKRSVDRRTKVDNGLLVFISITSGPAHGHFRHAARKSWLLPCSASSKCDYRFFVDIDSHSFAHSNDKSDAHDQEKATMHKDLRLENMTYGDLVFRDSCDMIMQRHPLHINYGNSPASKDNVFHLSDPNDTTSGVGHPDYILRRLYKVPNLLCAPIVLVQLSSNMSHDTGRLESMLYEVDCRLPQRQTAPTASISCLRGRRFLHMH